MSTSSEIVDSGRFSGMRTTAGKSSNLSQTCNLVSQYLKQKSWLNEIGFVRTCAVESNRMFNILFDSLFTIGFLYI